MINVQLVDIQLFIVFWLCFTRWLGILTQLPIFDDVRIPNTVKVLSCILISWAFFPHTKNSVINDMAIVGHDHFWLLTIFYLVTGFMVGFIVKAIMNIFISAGSIISQQIGFIAMRYFDPNHVQAVGPFENLLRGAVVVMVVSSGALLPMFKGGLSTFNSISITNISLLQKGPEFFILFTKNIFLGALLLASPIIFTNLIIMSVMGIIARMVPQMNVLMVSFVVNIGIGLIVISLISNELLTTAFKLYTDHLGDWFNFIT